MTSNRVKRCLLLNSLNMMDTSDSTISSIATASPRRYTIVYRTNSIDGLIAAFIAYTAFRPIGTVQFDTMCAHHRIKPSHLLSWVSTHVIFLDLIPIEEDKQFLLTGGVLTVEHIDYRDYSQSVMNTDPTVSSAIHTWNKYYSHQEKPFWLASVDRISRWKQPTWDDRCFREILSNVVHMPPADAMRSTESLMQWLAIPNSAEFQSLMAQAHVRLTEKDTMLHHHLTQNGRVICIQEQDARIWKLSPEWIGLKVFLMDNSDITIDSNEAAHLVFSTLQDVTVFINYRKKLRHDPVTKQAHMTYLYSARSVTFDLTTGGFFSGQKQSAGATIALMDSNPLPFQPYSLTQTS